MTKSPILKDEEFKELIRNAPLIAIYKIAVKILILYNRNHSNCRNHSNWKLTFFKLDFLHNGAKVALL